MKIKFGYLYNAPQGLRLTAAYSPLKMITVIALAEFGATHKENKVE